MSLPRALLQWLFLLFFVVMANATWATSVKVISYNIRYATENDGADQWANRKADLLNYLKKEKADFICVQEALHGQLMFLEQGLSGYSYIGVGRDDGHVKGEYTAIFYNRNSWNLESDSTFWLSATPESVSMGWDAVCHRVCTAGIFINKRNQRVSVLNTHFDHVGQVARKSAAHLIMDYMSSQGDQLSILAGDFNVRPKSEAYQTLTHQLSDAAYLASENKSDRSGTYNGFKLQNIEERRIDYIFINNPAVKVKSHRVPMILTKPGRQVSDHYPVVVKIKLK